MNDRLTPQQARILKLLFKFRFVTTKLLARILGIRADTTYEALECLVKLGYVVKEYDPAWRIDRKPAYYYLSHAGVRTIRALLGVTEPAVHALYKNGTASPVFIDFCRTALACYVPIKQSLPSDTELFSRSELARFKQFPKTRPDLYVRTPDRREAMIVYAQDMTLGTMMKRLAELITHSEEADWDGAYPTIGFVLSSTNAKRTFLRRAGQLLENMGMDEDDLLFKAADLPAIVAGQHNPWSSVNEPQEYTALL